MFALSVHPRLAEIPRADWNRLVDPDTPFLRHEFLAAMEEHECVGEALGWIPQHLALHDPDGHLVAAAPAYIKYNSYGELVFDWAWADAYRRAGLPYYPKLVIASPYTPATGPRLLTAPGPQQSAHQQALIDAIQARATHWPISSVHWLFTTGEETDRLAQQGLLPRLGCQYHWHNRGYRDFDDFLDTFSAEKRKKIKRERRRVSDAGLHLRRVPGDQVTDEEWAIFHRLYSRTFDKRGGLPTLSRAFFEEIAASMGEQLLLVLAYHGHRLVAAAFNLIGRDSLYGRHWGSFDEFHSLHFETCYYQGLEYCIEHRLSRFEPGAQGEYKVSRGFLPTPTWSAHWIADPRFRQAIAQFVDQEAQGVRDYLDAMREHSPYKATERTTANRA
ncbi:GNAT family N-acetyltransferase [Thioalkalicoccus limnaeus]|uniref:GNAT family N-acetyltransferase n=1 Tax=Thioalkalicoccus limnaeus TaxID=120681 RepID=A0ABV4BKJ7_9GAMM